MGRGFVGYLLFDVLIGNRKSGSRAASFPPQTWLEGVAWVPGMGEEFKGPDSVARIGFWDTLDNLQRREKDTKKMRKGRFPPFGLEWKEFELWVLCLMHFLVTPFLKTHHRGRLGAKERERERERERLEEQRGEGFSLASWEQAF